MERLKPIDLENLALPTSFRGFEKEAVLQTLRRAGTEIETLLRRQQELENECERMKQRLSGFETQESTLKDALVLAQKTADETRAAAHKEAELILESARQQAAEVQQEMRSRINDLRWELERLEIDKKKFLRQFRSLLEQQLQALGDTPSLPDSAAVEVENAEGPSQPSSTPSEQGV